MLANIIRNSKKSVGGGGGGIVGSISLDYLIVAGGGSGGSGSKFNAAGGGGGAGGVRQGTIGVNVGDTYALTVGNGGATAAPFALGNNGTNSVFGTLVAIGGGAGASHTVQGQSPNNIAGSAGGSGGGGSGSTALGGTGGAGGAGTAGQGNNGGAAANNQPLNGGGGGGAGAAGGASATGSNARAGAGGAGISSNITGNVTYYGGGGGGGIYTYNGVPYIGALQGLGGVGGGGNGGANATATGHGSPGTPNTGGGGGGGNTRDPSGSPSGTDGGTGGSGIVVLKCPASCEISASSGLVYSSSISGDYRISVFTSGTGTVSFQNTATDPYFSSTSLLLHMDGANGSTTFIDSSSNALAATRYGTPIVSTDQNKFGGASGYFNGSSDYITYSSANLFDFAGDFTVEGWWHFLQVNQVQGYSIIFCAIELDRLQLATVGNAIQFYFNGPQLLNYSYTVSNLLNTWTHVAITRSGTTVRMFLNGTLVASGTSSASPDLSGLGLGKQLNNSIYHGYFNGYIDEFRVTKGVARYTANFTPATSAFPNS
jgi:hypothetical protein